MNNECNNIFRINSIKWEKADQECRASLANILKTDEKNTAELCALYFDKFYLLHKIGHIIMHTYDENHHSHEARTEYCANLFAYKYLEFKGEKDYLKILSAVIQQILQLHKAHFDFDIEKMNHMYPRYKQNLLTYTAFHFNCFSSCMNNAHDFASVLKCMSKGKLETINNGVMFQKNINGRDLVTECLASVFELNDTVPVIELNYCSNLNVHNLDLELG